MDTALFLAILIWVGAASVASVHLVLVQRRPATAFSWLITFWLLPFAGAGWYLLFGLHRTPRSIRRRRQRQVGKVRQRKRDATPPTPTELTDAALERVIEQCSAFPARTGHALKILDQPLPEMMALIESAREEILLETYILGPGTVADTLKERLIEKAREGVLVRVLTDPVGSLELPRRYLRELCTQGIEAREFVEPGWLRGRLHVNLRNHRKLLVVDRAVACLGSANWADEYRSTGDAAGFVDLHVSVRGPSVHHLRRVFLEDWSIADGSRESASRLPNPAEDEAATLTRGHRVRVLASGPDETDETLFTVLQAALRSARRSVLIVTPYFVPGETMTQALRVACLGGVEVRILMPERSDSRIVDLAARHTFPTLLSAGAQIWLRPPPFLHAKAVVVDGLWSTLGSANFDQRSFHLNYELNIEITGVEFAAQLERRLRTDFAASRLLTAEEMTGRSTWRRLAANAAATLEPML